MIVLSVTQSYSARDHRQQIVGLTVINIIERSVRIIATVLAVVDNERASETITILEIQMRMIPESSRLVTKRNVICIASIRADGACRHKGSTFVICVRGIEKDPVKVLLGDRI